MHLSMTRSNSHIFVLYWRIIILIPETAGANKFLVPPVRECEKNSDHYRIGCKSHQHQGCRNLHPALYLILTQRYWVEVWLWLGVEIAGAKGSKSLARDGWGEYKGATHWDFVPRFRRDYSCIYAVVYLKVSIGSVVPYLDINHWINTWIIPSKVPR